MSLQRFATDSFCMPYFDPPKILLIIHIMMATTTTTINIPDQTPALKILSIAEQLDMSSNTLDINANGNIFFIKLSFNFY